MVSLFSQHSGSHTLSLSHTHTHTQTHFLPYSHTFSSLSLSLLSPSFSVMTHSSQVCTQHRLQMLFIEFLECSWEKKNKSSGAAFNSVVYWAGLAGAFVKEPTLLASLDRVRIRHGITLNYTAPYPLINTGSPSPPIWECGNTDWPCLHITRQNNELSLWIAGKCKWNSSVSCLIFTSVHGDGGGGGVKCEFISKVNVSLETARLNNWSGLSFCKCSAIRLNVFRLSMNNCLPGSLKVRSTWLECKADSGSRVS